jgi:hypothetical protein
MRASPAAARFSGARRDPFASATLDSGLGDATSKGVAKALLVAKQTGTLDVRGRGLAELPAGAFDPDADPNTEEQRVVYAKTIDFDAPDGASDDPSWWEAKELVAIVASGNRISRVPPIHREVRVSRAPRSVSQLFERPPRRGARGAPAARAGCLAQRPAHDAGRPARDPWRC